MLNLQCVVVKCYFIILVRSIIKITVITVIIASSKEKIEAGKAL